MWRDPGLRTVMVLTAAMTALVWLWLEASLSWEQRRMAEAAPVKTQTARTVETFNRESVALIAKRARRGENQQTRLDVQHTAAR
jgi:nitric oxide reductase large subunit